MVASIEDRDGELVLAQTAKVATLDCPRDRLQN
jgi:hypothetical protein